LRRIYCRIQGCKELGFSVYLPIRALCTFTWGGEAAEPSLKKLWRLCECMAAEAIFLGVSIRGSLVYGGSTEIFMSSGSSEAAPHRAERAVQMDFSYHTCCVSGLPGAGVGMQQGMTDAA